MCVCAYGSWYSAKYKLCAVQGTEMATARQSRVRTKHPALNIAHYKILHIALNITCQKSLSSAPQCFLCSEYLLNYYISNYNDSQQ